MLTNLDEDFSLVIGFILEGSHQFFESSEADKLGVFAALGKSFFDLGHAGFPVSIGKIGLSNVVENIFKLRTKIRMRN